MLDGITVLNSYEVVTKTAFSWQGFWVGLAVGVVSVVIGALIASADLDTFLHAVGIMGVICGVLSGLVFGFKIIPKPVEYTAEYEVTISDEVSMTDFHNRYDVIEQRNEIYVIREKEIDNHDN